jgi:hypothetical protein
MAVIKKPELNTGRSTGSATGSISNGNIRTFSGSQPKTNTGTSYNKDESGRITSKTENGKTTHYAYDKGGGGSSSGGSGGSGTSSVNLNDYRTKLATVDDIAKKYGFDYSRDYAKSQAEIIKQQQQDGLNETRQRAENDLRSSVESLDRNYFQQYQDMLQNQATTGINGALAADQALRSGMARQASMGDAYRDYNAQNYEINNSLGRLDAEATAYADQLYNQRRQEAFNNILALGSFDQAENQVMLQAALQQRGQDININQFDRNFNFQQDQADLAQNNWMQEFQRMLNRDQVGDSQWQQSFDWGRLMDEAGLTGSYNGQRTLQGQQFDWGKLMDESQLTGMYNNAPTWARILDEAGLTGMYNGNPTWDRERWQTEFDWNKYMDQQNLALARSRASGSGGGGRSGSSSSKSSGTPSGNLGQQYAQYQQEKESSSNTAIDKYYKTMESIFRPAPYKEPILPIPAPAQNPNIPSWQIANMIRKGY